MTNYPKRIGVKALCDNCKVYRITEPGMSVYNYVREDVYTEDIKQMDGVLDHWKKEAETARKQMEHYKKLNDDNLSDYNRLSTIYHDTHREKRKLESELTKLRTQFENRVNQAVAEKLQRMVSQRLRTARAMMQKTAEDLMNIPMERYDDDPWNNPAGNDGDAEE